MFWDRATLYAFRGAFPENDQRHLAAESALYCRVVTEGILGLEPLSLSTFRLSPKLPSGWPAVTLERLALQGRELDLDIRREGKGYRVRVTTSGTGETVLDEVIEDGGSLVVGT